MLVVVEKKFSLRTKVVVGAGPLIGFLPLPRAFIPWRIWRPWRPWRYWIPRIPWMPWISWDSLASRSENFFTTSEGHGSVGLISPKLDSTTVLPLSSIILALACNLLPIISRTVFSIQSIDRLHTRGSATSMRCWANCVIVEKCFVD